MCVWQSGDIPRSTKVVVRGCPQKRHGGRWLGDGRLALPDKACDMLSADSGSDIEAGLRYVGRTRGSYLRAGRRWSVCVSRRSCRNVQRRERSSGPELEWGIATIDSLQCEWLAAPGPNLCSRPSSEPRLATSRERRLQACRAWSVMWRRLGRGGGLHMDNAWATEGAVGGKDIDLVRAPAVANGRD